MPGSPSRRSKLPPKVPLRPVRRAIIRERVHLPADHEQEELALQDPPLREALSVQTVRAKAREADEQVGGGAEPEPDAVEPVQAGGGREESRFRRRPEHRLRGRRRFVQERLGCAHLHLQLLDEQQGVLQLRR